MITFTKCKKKKINDKSNQQCLAGLLKNHLIFTFDRKHHNTISISSILETILRFASINFGHVKNDKYIQTNKIDEPAGFSLRQADNNQHV